MRPVVLPEAVEAWRAEDGRGIYGCDDMPGWAGLGWFVWFKGGDTSDLPRMDIAKRGWQQVRDMMAAPRVAVYEVSALRQAYVVGEADTRPQCSTCGGSGEHECTCRDSHDCGECDGEGRIGKRPKASVPGLRVYRSQLPPAPEATGVDGRLGPLLDGFNVVRLCTEPDARRCALAGVDDAGDICVIVMPRLLSAEEERAAKEAP